MCLNRRYNTNLSETYLDFLYFFSLFIAFTFKVFPQMEKIKE